MKYPLYIFCIVCNLFYLGIQAQSLSNLRVKYLAIENDTVYIDQYSIIEGSLKLYTADQEAVPTETYGVNYIESFVYFLQKPVEDSLRFVYRVYPFEFTKKLFSNDYKLYKDYRDSIGFVLKNPEITSRFSTLNSSSLDFGKLSYDGDFSRGLSIGNDQSLNLNSSFNLQLKGQLAKDIELRAAITDNNIPIQPEGNTANIQDFDNVFIELSYKDHHLKLGDFNIKNEESYFMKFQKSLQGISYWGSQDVGKGNELNLKLNTSISRGNYTLQALVVEEGNQGPYKLQGANGESFIIVLSGSERVFVDGELMKRGVNHDYTIDYNLGEIRFTANRLITKNLRINVEFEYSANNYFRYLYHLNAGVSNKKWSFDTNFYSEQDVKNQSIGANLSNESIGILRSIGDSLNDAFVSGANSASFDNNRVLYEKIDTNIDGKDYVFYRYSVDSTKLLYSLSFSFLGEGRGMYDPIESVANGRVFTWLPPLANNSNRGSYDAVVLLVSPKKRQLFTTRIGLKPTKNTDLSAEFSLSNQDLNTFSLNDQEDNIGVGIHLSGIDERKLKSDSSLVLESTFSYENKHKNFMPIERYRQIEFQRNWNAPENSSLQENLGFASLRLKNFSDRSVAYKFSFYFQENFYNGFEHAVEATYNKRNWKNLLEFKWLDTKSLDVKTDFVRPKLNLSKSIKALNHWTIGLAAFNEINRIRPLDSDSLSSQSFWWQDYTVFFKSSDSLKSKYTFSYNLRYEHLPNNELFERAYLRANTFSLEGGLVDSRIHKLQWVLNYRNLQQDTLLRQNDDFVHFYLGRINYNYNIGKGFFVGNTTYEIGSGREQRIQYNYLRAPDGQGAYAWQDINENGIQELNEFYVSSFQNENLFLRITSNSLDFQAVNNTRFNQSLRIDPKSLWKNSSGFKSFVSRFSNISSLSLDKKIFAQTGSRFLDILNPLAINEQDTLLVANNNLIRSTFFFNRNDAKYAIDYSYNYNQNVNLLTSGFERRLFTSHTFNIRWNINKSFTWRSQYLNGYKRNDSDFFFDRRYEYIFNELKTDFSWIYKNKLRITSNYNYAFRSNPSSVNGGQFAVINETSLEIRYNQISNFNIKSNFRYASVAYNDMLFNNEQLEIDILQNLQDGNNFIWSLSFDKTIAKNFQINIIYEGRKTGTSPIINTGRAQVRAIF